MKSIYILLFLSIIFSHACQSRVDDYIFNDVFDAIKLAQNENKYVIVSRIAEGCHMCELNEKVLGEIKKRNIGGLFVFGKINYEPNNIERDVLALITKKSSVPCSFVISKEGSIVSILEGVKTKEDWLNTIEAITKNKLVPILWSQGEFNSFGARQLRVFSTALIASLLMKGNIDQLKKSYSSICRSVTKEPYFYNLYLKSLIENKLNYNEEAKISAKLALNYCSRSDLGMYTSQRNELKFIDSSFNVSEQAFMAFDTKEIDLGNIRAGSSKKFTINIKNNGKNPLILYDVSKSCSCTDVNFEKKPITQGEVATIELTYQAKNEGIFSKSITVHSNAINSPDIVVVKGAVE